jgi:hypothetical protein
VWALAIGLAWMVLISLTGLDEWLKELFGKKPSASELEERVDDLEKRVKELEQKKP